MAALRQGAEFDYVRQLHLARRAGKHADLRIGDKSTGLLSWAIPKDRFPENPGDSVLAIQQPVHRYAYGSFEGTIPEGRGAGTVSMADKGRAVITDAAPGMVRFALIHPRHPKEYMLVRKADNSWFLVNVTGSGKDAKKYGKAQYRSAKDPEPYLTDEYAASPKIDGAAALVRLLKNRIDVSSVRQSKTGQPLTYTWKIGGLDRVPVPADMRGAVYRGEVYGTARGKAIPAHALGGLLNTSSLKSRERQRDAGIRLLVALYGRADIPDAAREKLRRDFVRLADLTGGRLHPVEESDDPEFSRELLDRIRAGKHPLTSEGVVFRPKAGGTPIKHKLQDEYDVYIREIFPAETSDRSARAGGFGFSVEPDGPIVGRVGSGFSRTDAADMLVNPDEWIGRKARVRAQGQFGSGALRAPSFLARHEG